MKRKHAISAPRRRWTALLRVATFAAVALISGPAPAQVDTSEWQCQFCPFQTGYDAAVDAGADYVSDDEARFGNASGYDDAGVYVNLGGDGRYVSDSLQLKWVAEDLGLDSRVFELDGGRQGRFGFHLGYSELPYRLFDTTSTVFSATSGDTLELPANWVVASQTSGFQALQTSLQPIEIGSDRKTLSAGAIFRPSSDFSFFVDYRHQERDGVDIVSGSNFTQGTWLPRMRDFETDLVDAGIGYSRGGLSLSLAWFGSFFKNNLKSLTWDNPFLAFPGADRGRSAQEPDNEFQQVSLSGAYIAESLRSVVAFSAATGRGEQTDELLPYTINSTIAAGGLPITNLDGKVDTTDYALTITSKPLPRARLKLSYRYDERDNQTPRSTWNRVVVDSFQSLGSELNTPYSFERGRLSVSGSYRPFSKVYLSAGYDRTELERDFQEVAEQTENSGWGRARFRVADWLEVTAKGGTSRREIDRYDTGLAASFGQNPLLRKYNLAHRYREFGEFAVSVTPARLPVSLSLSGVLADDKYSKSELGLTDSESSQFSADLSMTVSETASLYVLAGFDDIDTIQLGSATFSTPTWQASHRDRFDHLGAGIRLREFGDGARLTVDYLYSSGDTRINVRKGGVDGLLPHLESELRSLRIKLTQQRSERLEVALNLRYESFKTSDWAIEGIEPDTIPSVLTFGADPYDYGVWVFGASFHYLVGGR